MVWLPWRQALKSARDLFYRLLLKRHVQRWKSFLEFSELERIRIGMYVIDHGNHVRAREIIDALQEAGDDRKPDSIARLIRHMRTSHFLEEDPQGFLSVRNPRQLRFVIKESRGSLLDSWFLVAVAIGIAAAIINLLERGSLTIELFLLALIFLSAIKILDDWLHESRW